MPRIKVNDVDLYYEDTGKGEEVIIFSHGLLWSGKMFDKQVEALKSNYRVITFDHRGQGRTEVTKNGYDIENLYQDAAALIEELNLSSVHFAGLSMGGFVAMRLAARRPELIKSLILLATSSDREANEDISKYKRLNFIARWLGLRLVAKPVMKIMFSQTFLNDKNRSEEKKYWKMQLIKNHRVGITRAVKGVISRESIYDELSNITCPTLIITGDEDVALPPEKSEKIHSAISNSQLVVIPKAGHTSTVEEPKAVNDVISKFLSNQ
ncbi:MAG: alpha/beta fold hydrolase [Candidatus Kariarchaeaceae archaeon]|jgi:pimeloyl-ACP methyl ester carboxylesterase